MCTILLLNTKISNKAKCLHNTKQSHMIIFYFIHLKNRKHEQLKVCFLSRDACICCKGNTLKCNRQCTKCNKQKVVK